MHRPHLQPYIIVAIVIYGVDKAMSLVKTRFTTARISNLDQLKMAYIEIPGLNRGWRAGQHVRLRVLSSGMGVLGWAESHPFTIASAGGAHEGLVLLCKQAGDWTEKLVALSKQVGQLEKNGVGTVKVCVDGPYGGPSRMVFSSFSGAVIVVGGSGITFGLSVVEELLMKDLRGESRIKYLELIWVVPDPGTSSFCESTLIRLTKSPPRLSNRFDNPTRPPLLIADRAKRIPSSQDHHPLHSCPH
mgnify:CR=1 FL=1